MTRVPTRDEQATNRALGHAIRAVPVARGAEPRVIVAATSALRRHPIDRELAQ
jgi:hypothetical protein